MFETMWRFDIASAAAVAMTCQRKENEEKERTSTELVKESFTGRTDRIKMVIGIRHNYVGLVREWSRVKTRIRR